MRNDDYWGEKAKLDRLIFRIIPDENARKQELQAGTIHGYDLPNPADWEQLRRTTASTSWSGRRSTSSTWASTRKNNPALRDIRVRQAIAYAIDRQSLVRNQLPEGAVVATQFIPGHRRRLGPT